MLIARLITWIGLILFSLNLSAKSIDPQHSMGTLTLASPAQRVVALNWSAAEMLLTLGVTPVGVTTIKGYKKWQSNHPAMPDGVTDVGSRNQVNLEAIAKLNPDLIVGYPWRHKSSYDSLSRIAPTVLLHQYGSLGDDDFTYFEAMQTNFIILGKLVGKESLAIQKLQSMHQTLHSLKQQIRNSGLENKSVVVGKAIGMGLGVRAFGPSSLADSILNQLGLENGWPHNIVGRDFSHIQIRELAGLKQSHVIFVGGMGAESARLFESDLWSYLPFVVNKRLHEVPQLWSFGGPVSAERMATYFAQALLDHSQNKASYIHRPGDQTELAEVAE